MIICFTVEQWKHVVPGAWLQSIFDIFEKKPSWTVGGSWKEHDSTACPFFISVPFAHAHTFI